jgi:hypothetical protein
MRYVYLTLLAASLGCKQDAHRLAFMDSEPEPQRLYIVGDPVKGFLTFTHHPEPELGGMICGKLYNTSEIDLVSVRVKFLLYLDDGLVHGEALDELEHLAAGETWDFECHAEIDFTKYYLVEMSGREEAL